MKFHGITLQEGSTVANMTLASGTSFPSNPNEGELFFRSDSDTSVRGMYGYIGGNWDRLASADAITVPSATNFPSTANVGDLFYKDSNDVNEALYVYNGSSWVATGNSGGTSTVDGDLSGTISIGGTSTLTLDTIASAGTSGSASKTVTITIDAKGRVTSLTEQDVAIAASQVTSGTFADARIAQSNVTQHQAAISVAASQVTSGTFADARIAQSNVTQHQAALTIAETQITNGSVLARVADNENISGNWAFNGTVSGQTPTNGAHLVTKDYADALATGLDFKQSVKAATTTNITLSGSQTIDGVAISAGTRVLVKDQTDGTENGIYVAASGAWTRAADADNTPSNEVTSGMFCYVEEGTVNADSGWVLATNDVITLGSTNLVFTQFTGLGQITAGNGLTKSGNTINVGGTAGRIVVNVDDIDLATVTDSGTGSFKKISVDSYGRVTGTTDVVSSDITSLVDSTYVNVAGDTMTGLLTISHTGNGLVVASTDSTPANNSGIILNTTANATASSRVATIVLDANGADGAGGDYVTLNAFGSGDFTINNRNVASITLQTNDTERVRIDSSGNVGIGTSSVQGALNIQRSSNTSTTDSIPAVVLSNRNLTAGTFVASGIFSNTYRDVSTSNYTAGIWFEKQNDSIHGTVSSQGAVVFGASGSSANGTLPTERMRIDAAGNVGIGVSPSVRLHARTIGSGLNTVARIERVNASDDYSLNINVDPDANVVELRAGGTQMGALTIATSNTERMRIDSSGNVLIGSTSVNYSAVGRGLLELNGSNDTLIAFKKAGVSKGYLQGLSDDGFLMASVSGSAGYLAFNTNALERMRINGAGNVGIGTTTPTPTGNYRVTEVRSSDATSGGMLIVGTSDSSGVGRLYNTSTQVLLDDSGSSSDVFIKTNGPNPVMFGTQNTERMRIDASGNVGIGTSSPAGKLEVSGATYSRFLNTTAPTLDTDTHAGEALYLRSGGTAGSGNVQAVLAFGKADASAQRSGAAIASVQTTADPDQVGIGFYVSSGVASLQTMTQAAIIDASGNVGIGTSSPTAKLHVYGTAVHVADGNGNGSIGSGLGSGRVLYGGGSNGVADAGAFIARGASHAVNAFGVEIYTNNTERMRIDASGNLMIGATTAAGILTVRGGTGAINATFDTPTAGDTRLEFKNNGTRAGYLYWDTNEVRHWSDGTRYQTFYTNGSERMRIDSSGNVGIGVTPSAWGFGGQSLEGANSGSLLFNPSFIQLSHNAFYNGTNWIYKASGIAPSNYKQEAGTHVWRTAASGTAGNTITWTSAMTLDANGNLGIGTATPAAKLQVSGVAIGSEALRLASSASNARLTVTNRSDGFGYDVKVAQDTDGSANKDLTFTFGTSERLRINSAGYVGVGTTAPVSLLDVKKDQVGSTRVTVQNANASGYPGFRALGTDVDFRLEVDNGAAYATLGTTTAHALLLRTSSVERMRIDASGNVLVTGSGGLGYGTGSGGTVTQATSKSTSVTLNKPSGQITMNNAALASNAVVAFPLSCSQIAAGDIVVVSLKSGHATAGTYQVWSEASTAGAVTICVRNISGSSLSEALVLNYSIIKGATS